MVYSPCNAVGFRLTLALALLLVTWQALSPTPVEAAAAVNDKLLHALAFAGLAFLADSGWPLRRYSWSPYAWLACYGIGLEGLQYLTAARTASFADLAADVAGLLFYWLLLSRPLRRRFADPPEPRSTQP